MVAVPVHQPPRICHGCHRVGCVAGIGMHREHVKRPRRSRAVEAVDVAGERHADPCLRDSGAHDRRVRVGGLDRTGCDGEEPGVRRRVGPGRPVDGQARLVPHLPRPHRNLRQPWVLAPEAASGPVAAHGRRRECAHVGKATWWIGAAAGAARRAARSKGGRIEEHGQHVQSASGDGFHQSVVAGEVVTSWRALDLRPVERLAQEADVKLRLHVQRLVEPGAG